MHPLKRVMLCLGLLPLWLSQAAAADQVLVFPSSTTNLITVLRAADLSQQGAIAAPSSSFQVVQTADGTKRYLLNRQASQSITVFDPQTLQILSTLDLGASSSQAIVTPDGRYLLVAAGTLRVVDTQTDTEIRQLQVGGGPTQIIVDNASTAAYVLAAQGRTVSRIDLETLTVSDTLDVANAGSIELTSDGGRLLAAVPDGILQFRTTDLERINTIETNFQLINASIHTIPNSRKVIAQNRGGAQAKTSQLVDLDTRAVRDIGNIGLDEIQEIVVVDSTKAYVILSQDSSLGQLNLTALPSPTITPLPLVTGARALTLSPNRRHLFVSSLAEATITKIAVSSNAVESVVNVPLAPSSHGSSYAPSPLPPAQMNIVGGNQQFAPPGALVATPFSVQVIDAEGTPLQGVPVLFDDPGGIGVEIQPSQPTVTNSRGFASIFVRLPEDEPEAPPEEPPAQLLSSESPDPELAAGGETIDSESTLAVLTESAPDDKLQAVEQEPIQEILITAAAPGVTPVSFTLSVIRSIGVVVIAGNNQIAVTNEAFPKELILLATDLEGRPYPPGTRVSLAASGAECGVEVFTDSDGFASFNCKGGRIPAGGTSTLGNVTVSLPQFLDDLGFESFAAAFTLTTITGGSQVQLIKDEQMSGDRQSAPTGTQLPLPLRFRVASNFSTTRNLALEITQLSGPPVLPNPRSIVHIANLTHEVFVTMGPNAGEAVLQIQASAPDLPTITYTMTATGGQPVSLETTGDGQVGKIARTLPSPLRVRVINESGQPVPFPDVTWRVIAGDAQLQTSTDPQGSSAIVTFGNSPGPVRVLAATANLQRTFNLTAVPPDPASISTVIGQNQTLTTGILSDPLIIEVRESDNLPAAGAVVTFSGPSNVRLHPLGGGAPGNPVQQIADAMGQAGVRAELLGVAVGLSASGGPIQQLATTVTITATLGGNLGTSFLLNVAGRTPEFEGAGAVNAASFSQGMVPGSLATLFGSGLMEGVIGNEFAQGSTSFRGTTVRVGGIPVPLLTLSAGPPEQINFQVPFEIAPGTTTIEVENNGSRSTVGGVRVLLAQPGIFEVGLVAGGSVGAVLHAGTGALVTPDTPAAHGEAVSLFLTGVGPTNPPGQTGVPGPVPPPLATLPVIVGVDNKGAPLLFRGYAPGFLGLYQINFEIPADARCGLRPLNVQVADLVSPFSTIAIRCP